MNMDRRFLNRSGEESDKRVREAIFLERLDQIAISPRPHGFLNMIKPPLGSDHEDLDRCHSTMSSNRPNQIEPGHAGQHHIEQHDIREIPSSRCQHLPSRIGIFKFLDLGDPTSIQHISKNGPHGRHIVDNQNAKILPLNLAPRLHGHAGRVSLSRTLPKQKHHSFEDPAT